MLRFIRSLFAWEMVKDQGVWRYDENRVTLARRAVRIGRCHQPLDFRWLDAGVGDARVFGLDRY